MVLASNCGIILVKRSYGKGDVALGEVDVKGVGVYSCCCVFEQIVPPCIRRNETQQVYPFHHMFFRHALPHSCRRHSTRNRFLRGCR